MREYTREIVDDWKQELDPYRRVAPPIEPAHSALLIIDMQWHFWPGCGPALSPTRRAISACRELSMPLVFTQHGHDDPESDGGMLSSWWEPEELITRGTEEHEIIPSTGVRPTDPVINEKERYDAFHNTRLMEMLHEWSVEDLTICGVMTNLCVETTARAAFVRDFQVRVLMDATATSEQWMHLYSLRNLAFGFAYVQTVDEWLDCLPSAKE